MSARIFEYAIILHPTQDESDRGVTSTLLCPPKPILAASDREAAVRAARFIPESCLDKMDRVEVAVRPF